MVVLDVGGDHHIRNGKGRANTQRAVRRFVEELIARVRRAGHTGPIISRADSGFENDKLMRDLARRAIEFSIGVKQTKTTRTLIAEIPEENWVTIADYPTPAKRRSPKHSSERSR